MTIDTGYTNGVIAVKERSLLGDKILRFPEMGTEEVLRVLSESGFGGGERDADAVAAREEEALDAFIRTYAPSAADKAYFLVPRDFHNLKALYKAEKLGIPADGMLAPEGLRTLDELREELKEDETAKSLPDDATGAEIGAAFDRAANKRLLRICRARPVLKKLIHMRIDMTDLLTCLRAGSLEEAEPLLLGGGTLKARDFAAALSEDPEKRAHALDGTPYRDFWAACLSGNGKGAYPEAERIRDGFEEEYFFSNRFALSGKEPFLYYIFRRRAEIRNIRTVLVCLNAGVEPKEIAKRLVGVK